MEFSFDRFYRMNRRAIIWIVLFGLIYLMRDFFTLIFMTFILAFLAFPAAQFLMKRLGLGRIFSISLVYTGILAGYATIVWLVAPSLVQQVNSFQKTLPEFQSNLEELHARYSDPQIYPNVSGILVNYLPKETIQEKITEYKQQLRDYIPEVSGQIFQFAASLLLAILFSFLILLDYFQLVSQVKSLRSSKLKDFYDEAGQPVVNFALAIGRGFQSIVIMSAITTLLMLVGMLILRLNSLLLLSVIVFLTGLVPVAGAVLQAIPLGLVALNQAGIERAEAALLVVLVVHVIIGYVVGPVIFGRSFRLNPVLVLIILFLGEQFFGIWGMILGIPVARYLIRDVFAVPVVEDGETAGAPARIEIKSEDETPAQKSVPPGRQASS